MSFTDPQRRDVLMLRGLNRTYGEIAAWLNDTYGEDYSSDQVGRVVRAMEDESRAHGARPVFDEVVSKGYLQDFLGA